MRYLMVVFFLLVIVPCTYGAENDFVVGEFSREPLSGELSEFWQPLEFDGVDVHTIYTHILDDGIGVIRAKSDAGSSGLVRKITINPKDYSNVSWTWKINNIIKKADLTQKKGDDAPARLYITFAYDSSQVGFWEMVKFEAIKLFYGEYPPIGALTYVWASNVPKGSVLDSPYTDRVKISVVRSGDGEKGEWRTERRNLSADYRMAFGSEDVPLISGIAIMTDTDNTKSVARAWYGNITFFR